MKLFKKALGLTVMVFSILMLMSGVPSATANTHSPTIELKIRDSRERVSMNLFAETKSNEVLSGTADLNPWFNRSDTKKEPVLVAGWGEYIACYVACRALGLIPADCHELCLPFYGPIVPPQT